MCHHLILTTKKCLRLSKWLKLNNFITILWVTIQVTETSIRMLLLRTINKYNIYIYTYIESTGYIRIPFRNVRLRLIINKNTKTCVKMGISRWLLHLASYSAPRENGENARQFVTSQETICRFSSRRQCHYNAVRGGLFSLTKQLKNKREMLRRPSDGWRPVFQKYPTKIITPIYYYSYILQRSTKICYVYIYRVSHFNESKEQYNI